MRFVINFNKVLCMYYVCTLIIMFIMYMYVCNKK